jgi:aerobic C4-dicarboxylate transport protein
MGMARALGNLIGNCVATVVVAAWEKDIDRATAKRVLDGEQQVDLAEHMEPAVPATAGAAAARV